MDPASCIGLDFGTSNTAAASPGAHAAAPARVLAIDPHGEDPRLLRSVLFFPAQEREVFVGAEAIAHYLSSGEGRLIQSFKSFLPAASFERTLIQGRSWHLHDLVAALLLPVRQRIEAQIGQPIKRLVLGRPAVFSPDPELDARAQATLAKAALQAGFPAPSFLIEPIAAALAYEETLLQDELVLVGDFGAGTSDFTLMQLGPSHAGLSDRQADIVASGGVYIGGDRFDAAIVEHSMLANFGANSTYMSFMTRTDLPAWIVRKVLYWHELALLRQPKTLAFLRQTLATSDNRRGLEQLLSLLEDNLGYRLYRAVEAAKRQLSHQASAEIHFAEGNIDLAVTLQRTDFDRWIQPLLQILDGAVDGVLQRGGGRRPDAVFLTGGSSKIPAVHAHFARRFGADVLRAGDAFTSVAAGLGRAAFSAI